MKMSVVDLINGDTREVEQFTNMTIILDMFGTFMKNIIVNNLNSILFVTIKNCSDALCSSHLLN